MNKHMFWLGIGVGMVVTSFILGVTTGSSSPAEEQQQNPLLTSDDTLREWAEERGYQLVSNAEWKRLNETKENTEAGETKKAKEPDTSTAVIYIYIPDGFSWEGTAEVLAEANIVKKSEDIMQAMQDMDRQRQLQSGLYTIQANESPREIVDKLSQ